MPTVLREDGFEVRIYTLDHPPPHVHVAKAGAIVRIDLATRTVTEIVALLQGGKLNGSPAHSAAQDIQAGLQAYERLSFQQIQDGHARAIFVVTTRGLLRRGDGMLSRVRAVLGQMKTDLDTWAKSRE